MGESRGGKVAALENFFGEIFGLVIKRLRPTIGFSYQPFLIAKNLKKNALKNNILKSIAAQKYGGYCEKLRARAFYIGTFHSIGSSRSIAILSKTSRAEAGRADGECCIIWETRAGSGGSESFRSSRSAEELSDSIAFKVWVKFF